MPAPKESRSGMPSPNHRLSESSPDNQLQHSERVYAPPMKLANSNDSTSSIPRADDVPTTSVVQPRVWNLYVKEASKWRTDFIEKWIKEMDSLLLFATLFSAVVTAFVVLVYPALHPDSGAASLVVLNQILDALRQNQTGQPGSDTAASIPGDTSFAPKAYAIRVNAFWFASLVISVSVAFLTILAKQWLASLGGDLHPSIEARGRQFQYRYDNAHEWKLATTLEWLPILLHISLLLFFIGLLDFLWSTNTVVAIVATVFVSVTFAIYIGTYMLSHLSATCPYRTSVDPTTVTWEFIRRLPYTSWKIAYPVLWLYRTLRHLSGYYGMKIPSAFAERIATLHNEHIARADTELETDIVSRESNYISDHRELVDARMLARMVQSFLPNITTDDARMLAHEISRYPLLVRYRDIFIEAGTVRFLSQWLHYIEDSECGLPKLKRRMQDEYSLILRALAQLLTEVEDGSATTGLVAEGPFRRYKKPQETMSLNADLALKRLRLSQTTVSLPASEDQVNIVQFSHVLRLQLVASSMTWYTGKVNLRAVVEDFCARLAVFRGMKDLEPEFRMSIVNTAIYVATRVIDLPLDNTSRDDVMKTRADYKRRAVDMFAELVLRNPGMEFPLIRQIAWVLAVLSMPEHRLVPKLDDFHLLITQAQGEASSLTPERILSTARDLERPSMLHLTLVLIEDLLYDRHSESGSVSTSMSVQNQPTAEETYRMRLLERMITKYPTFLRKLASIMTTARRQHNDDFQPYFANLLPEDLLRLLKRIVRISGCIVHYPSPRGLDIPVKTKEYIAIHTRKLLLFVCSFNHKSEGPWEHIYGTAYGAACRFALLDCAQDATMVPPPDAFVFDSYSPQQIGEMMDLVLKTASAVVEPPESISTVLTMIADLRFKSLAGVPRAADSPELPQSAKYAIELLSYLRDPTNDPERIHHLASLRDKGLHSEAQRALGALAVTDLAEPEESSNGAADEPLVDAAHYYARWEAESVGNAYVLAPSFVPGAAGNV
ncbi:uncharacterized protein B0H18DRAFT_1216062 [Fomitopsis serialis]|uniref:uncharacterized protein n=1 Tax=Fomitopsis serialis TaxID=139415 RepID=UPI0020082911|nr:uncharacterized protein B0H18DRAFT_1216062 [Neoantrodia serialis]KAH9914345.1 hypothetical protein B0H18DRAFT_1216062 [Neoantrodia serialis]